jgi:imidazolonepropionase-like amidohydrolase
MVRVNAGTFVLATALAAANAEAGQVDLIAWALGVIDTQGTITEGKLADLVVLDGDLQQDFSALSRTVVVFKGGRIAHGSLP